MGTRIARTVGALLLAVGVVGVPDGAHADTGAALLGAPAVGTCHLAKGADLGNSSPPGATRSCRKKHTLWVYAVTEVPPSLQLAPSDTNPALADYVENVCNAELARFLHNDGRRLYTSSYTWFWYEPTPEQQQLGARWISCELGIADGARKVLPNRLAAPPRLKPRSAQRLQLCYTNRFPTNCAAPHTFRAIYGTVAMSTPELIDQAANNLCARHLRGRAGGYVWEWYGRESYKITCSLRTRH